MDNTERKYKDLAPTLEQLNEHRTDPDRGPACPDCHRRLERMMLDPHEALDLDTDQHLIIARVVKWYCPCGYIHEEMVGHE